MGYGIELAEAQQITALLASDNTVQPVLLLTKSSRLLQGQKSHAGWLYLPLAKPMARGPFQGINTQAKEASDRWQLGLEKWPQRGHTLEYV